MIHEFKIRKDNRKENVCIDRYEAYNTSFGFLGLPDPNYGGLASHCHERLYTLRADVDRRRGIDIGGKWDNEHRKRVSLVRDT